MLILPKYFVFSKGDDRLAACRRISSICLFLLASYSVQTPLFAAAQAVEAPRKVELPTPGQAGNNSLLLSSGDLIDVVVFNTPELSGKLRIAQDGSIVMPAVGSIKVAGLTPLQANAVIEGRLRDAEIMLSPSVSVLVTDYATRGIDVLGEVRNPGIYMFLGTHSLYDALAAAGGVTELQGSTITITHHSDLAHPVVVQVSSPNYSDVQRRTEIEPGDVVDVSRADSIYVVGDVAHSGRYPISYGKPITALNALALAQGPNKTAKLTKASIVRKTVAGADMIPLDLQKIQKNTESDPLLQPDDVLVIPRSGVRAFAELAIPGATTAVIGAVAYGYIRN